MENKEKTMQPPFQNEHENISADEKLEGGREGWKIENLAREASQKDEDEIQRQTLRGNESKGNPNERDIAGQVDQNETPHGREEAKNNIANKANANG